MHLKDKIAIVTGAGIGEAISHKFAHNGAKLVLAGLPSDPVQDVAAARALYDRARAADRGVACEF